MKLINTCLFFWLFFLFLACEKTPELPDQKYGELEIIIKGKYNGSPLVKGSSYTYWDGTPILFSRSEFYLSDIKLVDSSTFYLLSDVEFVTLLDHHVTVEAANQGYVVLKKGNLPVGTYQSLNFAIGLNKDQNKTKPVNYTPPHPLSEGSRYWAGWFSYVFSKTEGVLQSPGNPSNFTFHSGFNNSLRQINGNKSIQIVDGKLTTIIIEIDHQILFGDSNDFIDIKVTPQIHNSSAIMDKFMDQFPKAMISK